MRPDTENTPSPAGFLDVFRSGGWRAIDRRYGAPTRTLRRWVAETRGGRAYAA